MARKLPSLRDFIPGIAEGDHMGGGKIVTVHVPLGPPLLVDGTTYKQVVFIAPSNGCEILGGYLSGAVSIGAGTNTLALEKYDASGNAGANILSTANIDPDTITAKEGLALTLSSTYSALQMDRGDTIWATLVCGTMVTAGEGYMLVLDVLVPERDWK